MTILLLYPYFKIKCWIYRCIFGVLVKNSLNLILLTLIPLNFEGNENFKVLRELRGISVPFYQFHSLLLKLTKQENEFSLPSIKTSKQGKGRKGKNIIKLFFLFISIPFYFLLLNKGLGWVSHFCDMVVGFFKN